MTQNTGINGDGRVNGTKTVLAAYKPQIGVAVLGMVMAIFFGSVLYSIVNISTGDGLIDAYAEDKPLLRLLQKDSAVTYSPKNPESKDYVWTPERLFLLCQNIGLAAPDENQENFFAEKGRFIKAGFDQEIMGKNVEENLSLTTLLQVISAIGANQTNGGDALTRLVNLTLMAKAGAPELLVRWDQEINAEVQANMENRVLKTKDYLHLQPTMNTKTVLTQFGQTMYEDREILRRLYRAYNIDSKYSRFHGKNGDNIPQTDGETRRVAFSAFDAFNMAVLSEMNSSNAVRKARGWVGLTRGVEQLVMLILFIWAIEVLIFRFFITNGLHHDLRFMREVKRETLREIKSQLGERRIGERQQKQILDAIYDKLNEKEPSAGKRLPLLDAVYEKLKEKGKSAQKEHLPLFLTRVARDNQQNISALAAGKVESFSNFFRFVRLQVGNSRWFVRWMAKTMPAIGFIGTVRGISLALSNSDSIVRAESPVLQAFAITSVSGKLGIAFTTTLIALMLGLAISWFLDHGAARENEALTALEKELTSVLDPTGFEAEAT